MSKRQPSDEFIDLAVRLADEGLADADLEELHRLVESDRANAEWFVEWMELNAMLELDLGNRSPMSLTPRPLMPPAVPHFNTADGNHAGVEQAVLVESSGQSRSEHFKLWLTLAASLMLCAGFLFGGIAGWFGDGWLSGEQARHAVAVAPGSIDDEIATIASGVDAAFGGGRTLGSRLTPGLLRVEKGIAQIVFDRGAVVVMQGPAELKLIDAGACRLVSGTLAADVAPDTNGFRVDAGDIQIYERNARFGLKTGPEMVTEVHALGGGLDLVGFRAPNGEQRRLAEGEALRWKSGSSATEIALAPESFVSSQELARWQEKSDQLSYQRWLNYSQRWLKDPSVELRYEFSPNGDVASVNTVDPNLHAAKSRQLSPRWIAGRWSNKMSMLFDGRTDVLEVPDHLGLRMENDFSLAVWMRVRSYSKKGWTRIVGKGDGADRNYGLWMDKRGALLWQVCPDADPESQSTWDRYSLATRVLPIDEWQCVVGVVDGGEFRVYINGELQAQAAAPLEIATSDDPLTIGHYADFPFHDEFFCGELDELMLLRRPLSESEIRAMYEAGRPSDGSPGADVGNESEQEAEAPSSV